MNLFLKMLHIKNPPLINHSAIFWVSMECKVHMPKITSLLLFFHINSVAGMVRAEIWWGNLSN